MRVRALRAVAGLVGLTGCPPADDGGGVIGALRDPEVTITAQGSGPANAATLEPLRIGAWLDAPAGAHRVLGPQTAGDAELRSLESTASARGTPGVPTVGVLRQRDGDVVIHRLGAPLDVSRPAGLLVPATVRPGMRFESALDDNNAFGMTVLDRQERMSPLGPIVVWSLQEDLGDGVGGTIHRFAEGLGAATLAFAGERGNDAEVPDTWVFPERDQAMDSLPLSPEDLRPFVDAFGRPMSVFRVLPNQCVEDTEQQWGAMVDGVPFLVSMLTLSCSNIDPPAPYLSCLPLARGGDVVTAARRCRSVLETALADPITARYPAFLPLEFARRTRGLAADGVHVWRENGRQRRLIDRPDPNGNTGRRRLELHRDGDVLGATVVDVVTDTVLERGLRPDTWSWTRAPSGFTGPASTALTTFGPWDVAPGAPVVVGAVQTDGRVYELRLEGTRLVGWRFVGVVPGVVSLTDTDEGTVVVGVTSDLRLHRARVVSGRVVVEALGDLPPVSFARDAVSASLDPTDLSRLFVKVQRPPGVVVEPEGLNARIFTTTLSRQPQEVAAPATLGLGFGDWFGDVVVCWPPTDERPDTSGWTLRGSPVETHLFTANDACALLRNDAPVDEDWIGAERAMALDLPGIGPVQIGYRAGTAWDFGAPLQGRVAPMADGGVVDIAGLILDAEGYPVERTPTEMAAGTITERVHRDLSGDGHYAQPNVGTLVAIGSRTRIPREAGWSYIAGVTSGGVILDDGTQWLRFDPGGETPIPTVQRNAVVGLITAGASLPPHVTALDDGRMCVALTPFVACVGEDGAVARAADAFIPSGDSGNGAVLWPLPGGDLLVLGTNGSVRRLDPDTMTVAHFVDGQLRNLLTTADGRVLGLHDALDGSRRIVEVTDGGLVEVLVEAAEDFVPLKDSLLMQTAGVWRRVWR